MLEKSDNVYGSFNSYRSALALILPGDIGNNMIIKRFMKGVSKIRPQKPRYNFTWDPKQIFDYFENHPPNSFKMLSIKLITLLTLATGQRIQTLSLIKLFNIKECGSNIQIFIDDQIKTSGVNRKQPCLLIPKFSDKPSLCVVSCLQKYIEESQKIRGPGCDKLFITLQKPHKVASKQTLSRWVKSALHMAGIDVSIFKAHSCRHASTSAAQRAGVSLDIIRDSAGWSKNSETFARFYNRPLLEREKFATNIFDI